MGCHYGCQRCGWGSLAVQRVHRYAGLKLLTLRRCASACYAQAEAEKRAKADSARKQREEQKQQQQEQRDREGEWAALGVLRGVAGEAREQGGGGSSKVNGAAAPREWVGTPWDMRLGALQEKCGSSAEEQEQRDREGGWERTTMGGPRGTT